MTKLLHGLFPIAAVALAAGAALIGTEGLAPIPFGATLFYGIASIVLIGTVFAAVHHAETIAHIVGEPFGTRVATIAVTVIEVSLIASIMLGGEGNAALARDTVFSVIMIVCNGLVGLCLLLGGLRYREQDVQRAGGERLSLRARRARGDHPGAAELYDNGAWAGLLRCAACLRR